MTAISCSENAKQWLFIARSTPKRRRRRRRGRGRGRETPASFLVLKRAAVYIHRRRDIGAPAHSRHLSTHFKQVVISPLLRRVNACPSRVLYAAYTVDGLGARVWNPVICFDPFVRRWESRPESPLLGTPGMESCPERSFRGTPAWGPHTHTPNLTYPPPLVKTDRKRTQVLSDNENFFFYEIIDNICRGSGQAYLAIRKIKLKPTWSLRQSRVESIEIIRPKRDLSYRTMTVLIQITYARVPYRATTKRILLTELCKNKYGSCAECSENVSLLHKLTSYRVRSSRVSWNTYIIVCANKQ